jgi:hypothetical protein
MKEKSREILKYCTYVALKPVSRDFRGASSIGSPTASDG